MWEDEKSVDGKGLGATYKILLQGHHEYTKMQIIDKKCMRYRA